MYWQILRLKSEKSNTSGVLEITDSIIYNDSIINIQILRERFIVIQKHERMSYPIIWSPKFRKRIQIPRTNV